MAIVGMPKGPGTKKSTMPSIKIIVPKPNKRERMIISAIQIATQLKRNGSVDTVCQNDCLRGVHGSFRLVAGQPFDDASAVLRIPQSADFQRFVLIFRMIG